jgi:acyl phosphate:glycerol-3-phosphate acyltransferase
MTLAIILIIAYLIGTCPSAVLTCRILKLPDPRQQGSNNPGATNVLRLGGKKAGIITLAADVIKGLIPIIIAKYLDLTTWQLGLVGLAACLGHIFPIFSGFKGGKGVATNFGVIWAISPVNGAITTGVWLLVALLSRYASLASMTATISAAATSLWFGQGTLGLFLIAALVVWRHRANIARLKQGQESKIMLKKATK